MNEHPRVDGGVSAWCMRPRSNVQMEPSWRSARPRKRIATVGIWQPTEEALRSMPQRIRMDFLRQGPIVLVATGEPSERRRSDLGSTNSQCPPHSTSSVEDYPPFRDDSSSPNVRTSVELRCRPDAGFRCETNEGAPHELHASQLSTNRSNRPR